MLTWKEIPGFLLFALFFFALMLVGIFAANTLNDRPVEPYKRTTDSSPWPNAYLKYFKDPRTDLCFAVYHEYGSNGVRGIACVPCDSAKELLEKP